VATPQKSKTLLVIVGFAEALAAPEVVWSLADQGAEVVAFTRKGVRPALASSRYVSLFEITAPEKDCAQATTDLKRQISSLRQSNPSAALILMPLDDGAVWLVNRLSVDAGVIIAGPTGAAAALALNKAAQMDFAQKAGFAVPRTRRVDKAEEAFSQDVGFPLVFKPVMAESERDGKLGRGRAWTCADRAELETAVKIWGERQPMLLQQYVSGVGEGLFGLAAESEVIGWSAHRRLRMMNPQGSGSSACVSREVDLPLREAGERFVALSGWRGLFMIELLRDESGQVWFMELNGRPWGSMALARHMGLDYPAWALQLALHPEAQIVVPPGMRRPLVCRHLGRELVHLLFVLRGPKSKALSRWPSRWSAARQVLSFTRHDRWYNWRDDDRKVFFSDMIGTVKGQLFKSRNGLHS
jgi:predicted ATP-grasp superfamily ATP-dependent carboligase